MLCASARPWPAHLVAGLNDPSSDLELVAKAKRGDAEAFSMLVLRHQHKVYSLAYRYMRDANLAEDMAQEAFLKGFRLLKGFRGDCSFSTWMYRVTSSVCLTEIARRKRRSEVPFEARHGGAAENDTTGKQDMAHIVRRCVARLPERYATIMTLYYLEETPYGDIAAAMAIPVGTLKTWMFRARKELRKLVEQELAGDGLDTTGRP